MLIVRVPETDVNRLRELRDYVRDSLAHGILVLSEDASCEVMELPLLGQVEVMPVDEGPKPAPEPEAPTDPVLREHDQSDGAEKRVILQRLIDYRAANGLGSLSALSAKTAHNKKDRLSSDELRRLISGELRLEIGEWRKVSRALDRLKKEGADGNCN